MGSGGSNVWDVHTPSEARQRYGFLEGWTRGQVWEVESPQPPAARVPWPSEVSVPLTHPEQRFSPNTISGIKLVLLNLHFIHFSFFWGGINWYTCFDIWAVLSTRSLCQFYICIHLRNTSWFKSILKVREVFFFKRNHYPKWCRYNETRSHLRSWAPRRIKHGLRGTSYTSG